MRTENESENDNENKIEIRKLTQKEKALSRDLYEEVFSEDKGAFSDYYYRYRVPENTIYAAVDRIDSRDDGRAERKTKNRGWRYAEDCLDDSGQSGIKDGTKDGIKDGIKDRDKLRIHAMIHLNPVRVSWNGKTLDIPYFVAVATEEKMRHRGLMRQLLTRIFQDLQKEGVPFCFLMPINEAIYLPFGFRRTWSFQWEEEVLLGRRIGAYERDDLWQISEGGAGCGHIEIESEETGAVRQADSGGFFCPAASPLPESWGISCRAADTVSDQILTRLSENVNQALAERFELFTLRSCAYYRRLAAEQNASGGRLLILFQGEEPLSAMQTARDDYPAMMCRVINEEAFARGQMGGSADPFSSAFISELV